MLRATFVVLAAAGCIAPLAAQPGVFNIRAEQISHSTVRLVWDTTSLANKVRVRYGITAAYEAGPGGGIMGPAMQRFVTEGLVVNVTALAPSTTYQFCPQVSSDGGKTWSECVNFTATTTAREQTHPQYPEPPPTFDTSYPKTIGYTIRSVSSNCSDLQAHMDAAAAAQTTAGSIIEIPAGTVCKGMYILPSGTDVKKFAGRDVRTSTSTIALPNHGFSDGQAVKLAGILPGSAGSDYFRQNRGVKRGEIYYVKRLNGDAFSLSAQAGGPVLEFATSTFTADEAADTFTVPSEKVRLMDGQDIQVTSTGDLPAGLQRDTTYYVKNSSVSARFQLSAALGGPPIDIMSAGTGTHSFTDPGGGAAIMAWPPPVENWIIVRTATRDEQFVPEGIRVTPEWKSRMAEMRPPQYWDNQNSVAILNNELAHHWRFTGIEFTHDDVATREIATTIDPHGYYGFLWLSRDVSNIVLDRCYIHGLGYPNRVARAFVTFGGANMAIVNSYWDKLDWWLPYRDGVEPSTVGTALITISRGTYYLGPSQRTLSSPVVLSFSGNATGEGKIFFDMNGPTLRVLLPTGMSASCVGYSPCVVEKVANPEFPVNNDTDRQIAAAPIASITLVDGKVTALSATRPPSTGMLEGASSFIGGLGPGPFVIENNYISSTGIPIHFDDSGNGHYPPGKGYIVRRNHFTAPLSQLAGSQWSDGRRYGHRHHIEWKNGTHILIDGNIFEHSPGENTPVGTPVMIMATEGGAITDVTISNNLVQFDAGGMAVEGPIASGNPGKVLQRVHIFNNMFYRLDGYTYAVKQWTNGLSGAQIIMGAAMEDVRIEYNTVYDSRGRNPAFFMYADEAEGLSITDNVIWSNGSLTLKDNNGSESTPSCPQYGKSGLDCSFRAGVNNPDYTFSRNTVIAGWSDRNGTQPMDPSWLKTMFAGSDIEIYSMAEAAAKLGWSTPEHRDGFFTLDSKLKGAQRTALGDRGANMDAMNRALGRFGALTVAARGASSATISFTAPAKDKGCYVLYGTGEDITAYSRTAVDRSNALERTIELRDVSPGFVHRYVVMCEGAQDQPRGAFEPGQTGLQRR